MSAPAVSAAQAGLAAALRASGRGGPAVSAAFAAVPRHRFRPEVEAVRAYDDTAIVTKSDASGLPVSSSTQPAMMAIMLEQLELAAGQRVLEIGTGAGYNAALLAQITGDSALVATVDIEPDVVERTRPCGASPPSCRPAGRARPLRPPAPPEPGPWAPPRACSSNGRTPCWPSAGRPCRQRPGRASRAAGCCAGTGRSSAG